MDKVTFVVEVLESEKSLSSDDFDDSSGYAALLVAFNEGQQVLAKWFEDYTDVGGLRALVAEGVKKGNNILSARMGWREGRYPRKKFDFVPSSLSVTPRRLDHLECRVPLKPRVAGW